MKWRVDPKKPRDRREWHTWFAWYPVRCGAYICWLQFMSRKGDFHDDSMGGYWVYEYQFPVWHP